MYVLHMAFDNVAITFFPIVKLTTFSAWVLLTGSVKIGDYHVKCVQPKVLPFLFEVDFKSL